MEKALQYKIAGIKCDACDYKDEDVQVEDYPEWVNKPCPECGENLLTEDDFNFVQRMIGAADIINGMFKPSGNSKDKVTASIELDGTGGFEMNVEKAKDE